MDFCRRCEKQAKITDTIDGYCDDCIGGTHFVKVTKVSAIAALIKDNGGQANWKVIENKITDYYPEAKASQFWKEGLRGVVYREIRYGRTFKMAGKGIVSLV